MIQVIRVTTKIGPDIKGNSVLHDIKMLIHNNKIKNVKTARVYRLEGITEREAKLLAEKLFCESINQAYSLNKPASQTTSDGDRLNPERSRRGSHGSSEVNPIVIEIAYQPGVMNPEAASIIKSANDLGIHPLAADSSTEYQFIGDVLQTELQTILQKIYLFNKTVEYIVTKEPATLIISGKAGKTTTIPIRKMTDKELMQLSHDKLFLNLEEMKIIQQYFLQIKRDPTDCEIETLAQTWSEHSVHKTFKANIVADGKNKPPLFSRLKKEALKHPKHIVSAFVDNSGVMDFYDGWAICGKGETHNSPSAIEPYGGAMTGSGGVFRDIVGTGLGGKTLVSTDVFCLARPDLDPKLLPDGCLPSDYILKRVITAVKDYGNRVGIPTNNGSLHFHDDFRAKPTVLVGAFGIMPKKTAQIGKPQKNDLAIIIGGRTGRDGIHGATFSSGIMTHQTQQVQSQAVQIGNAIEEKRTFDAILEARDKNLIRALQDVGGGGLSSALGEMAKDLGIKVQLKNVQLKYPGLAPWEIWVSESQERMALVISPDKLKKFKDICQKYNVEMQEVGTFDGSKKLQVFYDKELVCNLDMAFLHHGLPQRTMMARRIMNRESRIKEKELRLPNTQDKWLDVIKKILSHGNVCSKEPIVRLYDHTVQGTSVLQPYSGETYEGPNDAAVIRPLLNKPYGMVVSHGLNPILNNIDPYWGSLWAGVEALSNYVAAGGDYRESSLINNYIWPFPDEESLWSLDQSVDAVVKLMNTFKIPVISGKDSLSSTFVGQNGSIIKIPPVLCVSVFGKIPDVTKTTSSDLKKTDSVLVLVGQPDWSNLGGSVYLQANSPKLTEITPLPHVNLKLLPKIFTAIHKGIVTGQILSAHDISEGGLITTIFEMCVGGNIGASISLNTPGMERPNYILFNETAGCFVIEIADEKTAKQLFQNIPYTILGKTQSDKTIAVKHGVKTLFTANLDDLKKSWQAPMKKYFS